MVVRTTPPCHGASRDKVFNRHIKIHLIIVIISTIRNASFISSIILPKTSLLKRHHMNFYNSMKFVTWFFLKKKKIHSNKYRNAGKGTVTKNILFHKCFVNCKITNKKQRNKNKMKQKYCLLYYMQLKKSIVRCKWRNNTFNGVKYFTFTKILSIVL